MSRGIVYIAVGQSAKAEADKSIASLRQHCDLPVHVVDEMRGLNCFGTPKEGYCTGSRIFLPGTIKQRLWALSPYQHTLYLDADTRVMADVTPVFDILAVGWDMILVPGQAARFVRDTQFAPHEKDITIRELGTGLLYYYNSGVIAWTKNERTQAFFQAWGEEWERFRNWDEQMALMRALWRTDVEFITLPQRWNQRELEGALIHHDTGNKRAW